MMEFLRDWLLAIVGTTMMISLAESLMPKGPVKEVGKFLCGLVLLLVIIVPVLEQTQQVDIGYDFLFSQTLSKQQEEMQNYYNFQYKSIIERELEAYIVDKAMEIGFEIEPIVVCIMGEDGVFVPYQVDLGELNPEDAECLIAFVCQDLGLETTGILVKEAVYEPLEIPTHQ